MVARASGDAWAGTERGHSAATYRVDTGGDGYQPNARYLCLGIAIAVDDCRLCAADCVRKPGKPDAGARHGAAAADGDLPGAGSAAPAADTADAGGEPVDRGCRKRGGIAAVGLRLARHAGDGDDGRAYVADLHQCLMAGVRVCTWSCSDCGGALRVCSCMDHLALRSD